MVNSEYAASAPLRLRSGQAHRLSGRRLAFVGLILSLTLLLSASAIARNKRSASPAVPDHGYTSALAAANRFLQAWQNQDHETGLLMLTDTAKQSSSADRLEAFFTSGPDAAYEIARGKKLKAGRYAFPVTLFPSRSEGIKAGSRQRSEIVVVRSGKVEWAIDKLP
jgi:hypothetical protein